jgi:hypothetical protein
MFLEGFKFVRVIPVFYTETKFNFKNLSDTNQNYIQEITFGVRQQYEISFKFLF